MKILILSGTHGNEQSAVRVGLSLFEHYDNDSNITIIPFVNESGLYKNSRFVESSSTTDLNRSFFEEEEFEKDYNKVVNDLKDIIKCYDVVIDIHNSPRCSNFCLIDEGLNRSHIVNLCRLAGVEYATRYSGGGTIKDYTNRLGKTGITYEFSGMSTLNSQKEQDLCRSDIINLVNIIQNDKKNNPSKLADKHYLKDIYCLESGFLELNFDINDIIKPGEQIGSILNEQNTVINTIINEFDTSIKIIVIGSTFVKRGASIMQVIKI